MKTIAFHIQKGGTGKTSCAGNAAAGLGRKTALIDCDQQGNASSWFLTSPIDFELADILTGKAETSRAVQEIAPGLSLIPVSPLDGNLTAFAETQLIKNPKAFEFLIADHPLATGTGESGQMRPPSFRAAALIHQASFPILHWDHGWWNPGVHQVRLLCL